MIDKKMIQGLKTSPKDFAARFFKTERGESLVLTAYQNKQLGALLTKLLQNKPAKFVFRQARRSGKSELISVFIAMAMLLRPVKIANVSYTAEQATIIFERVKAHLVYDNDWTRQFVNLGQSMVTKKEFSKTRFHMINGSQFRVFSTGRGETEFTGESLLGFGADIVIVDEAASIIDSVFRTKIMPLIADARSPKFVLLSGTPHRKGYMWEAEVKHQYTLFHVPWEIAVAEGQLKREEIPVDGPPREFRVWWQAEWPDDDENQLIHSEWITHAKRDVFLKDAHTKSILGVDVARYGRDLIVFTHVHYYSSLVKVMAIKQYAKLSTMQTVGLIRKFCEENHVDQIIIDDGGLGAGVVDRLKELPEYSSRVKPFVFGGSPYTVDKLKRELNEKEKLHNSRFLNNKSFYYHRLAQLFEKGAIVIPSNFGVLEEQLASIRVEYTSEAKAKILDNKDDGDSPDFSDSLMMACSNLGETGFVMSFV